MEKLRYEQAVLREIGERRYSRRIFPVEVFKFVKQVKKEAAAVAVVAGTWAAVNDTFGPYVRIRYASEVGYESLERTLAIYPAESLRQNVMVVMGDSNAWGDIEPNFDTPPPYPSAKYIERQMEEKGINWRCENIAKPGMMSHELLERIRKESFKKYLATLAQSGNIDLQFGIGGNDLIKNMLLNPAIRTKAEALRDDPRRSLNLKDLFVAGLHQSLTPEGIARLKEDGMHNFRWTKNAADLAKLGEDQLNNLQRNYRQILETLLQLKYEIPQIQHISVFGVPYITSQDMVYVPLNGEQVPINFSDNPDARSLIQGSIATVNMILKRNMAELQQNTPGILHFIPVGTITDKNDLRKNNVHLSKSGQDKVGKYQMTRLVDVNGRPLLTV